MNKDIDALLQERQGYVKRNLPKRVEAVDVALRELGFDHDYMTNLESTSVSLDVETTTRKKPTKRKKG